MQYAMYENVFNCYRYFPKPIQQKVIHSYCKDLSGKKNQRKIIINANKVGM